MNNQIVSFRDLCELCAREQPAAVKEWLNDNDIPYLLDADDRPCTIERALHEALTEGKDVTSALIVHEDLKAATGLVQAAVMRKHLRKVGVYVKEVNGRLFTTTDALTQSLVGRARKRRPNFEAFAR